MDCSMPGFPVHHQPLELAQTPVHRVSYAIQPSHPLLSPSPPAFNLSQQQGLFQFFTSGGQSIGASSSASVLPMNIQDWFPLGLTGLISLQSKGLSRTFSNTTVQKHQERDAQRECIPVGLAFFKNFWVVADHPSFWRLIALAGVILIVPCLVTQLCPTLCNPMDCSLPGSSVHWDSLDKNMAMESHVLLQGILPIQG